MRQRHTYFSTRDLLLMATLATLGGVAGIYINAVGDFFQSILGFTGSTQWAAGLHVIWLTLAVGLIRKQGAGTITGLLKGGVELFTGNTHGLLVVLVNVVAGLLVDLGFLPFRKKDSLAAFYLAGGLASASNVFVFQVFASVPADSLAYSAMLLVAGVAALSGVLFSGVLGRSLLNTLRRAGVVKDATPVQMGRHVYPFFIITIVLLTMGLAFYLHGALRGPSEIRINGAVHFPFTYPSEYGNQSMTETAGPLPDAISRGNRVPLRDLLDLAQPDAGASLVLIRATDGYAFFFSMGEIRDNDTLLLSPQGEGSDISYNIDGAVNSKAWVRGVEEIVVVGETTLIIGGALDAAIPFDPDHGPICLVCPHTPANRWVFQLMELQINAVAAGVPDNAALKVTGNVNTEVGWTEDKIYSMDAIEAESTNKDGETSTYTGIRISDLLSKADPKRRRGDCGVCG